MTVFSKNLSILIRLNRCDGTEALSRVHEDGETRMRILMMVKAPPSIERVEVKREDLLPMGKYNDMLRDAGVLVSVDGLRTSDKGVRLNWKNGTPTVTDGPFTEAKELVAGFWILDVKSMQEAIDWAKKIPFTNGEGVEIRQIAEASDFNDAN